MEGAMSSWPGTSGSIQDIHQTSSSSNQNPEEDVSGNNTTLPMNVKDRRRLAHVQAEQRRRDELKKGYDALQELVPTCRQPGVPRPSKAVVVQKTTDYIQYLVRQRMGQEIDRNALRKNVEALKIMQANYEHIVRTQQSCPTLDEDRLSDEDMFYVFQEIMDQMFETFKDVPTNNFSELSAGVFNWLEEHCKPQSMKDIVCSVLRDQNYIS